MRFNMIWRGSKWVSFAFICRICIAVVSILPACASFPMALVTFGGAGASYLPYPAGAGTSPSGGAGCRLCASRSPWLWPFGIFGLWEHLRYVLKIFKDSSSLEISHLDRHIIIIRSRMVTWSTNLPRTWEHASAKPFTAPPAPLPPNAELCEGVRSSVYREGFKCLHTIKQRDVEVLVVVVSCVYLPH